jgi:hypothetical protein
MSKFVVVTFPDTTDTSSLSVGVTVTVGNVTNGMVIVEGNMLDQTIIGASDKHIHQLGDDTDPGAWTKTPIEPTV